MLGWTWTCLKAVYATWSWIQLWQSQLHLITSEYPRSMPLESSALYGSMACYRKESCLSHTTVKCSQILCCWPAQRGEGWGMWKVTARAVAVTNCGRRSFSFFLFHCLHWGEMWINWLVQGPWLRAQPSQEIRRFMFFPFPTLEHFLWFLQMLRCLEILLFPFCSWGSWSFAIDSSRFGALDIAWNT